MQDWLVPYATTIWSMGTVGGLLLLQIVVLDVAGIRAGHRPGMPVEADPARFLFRASRAHANTNESIAAFMLLATFGILVGASPRWLNGLAAVYVAARVAHMLCYYAGVQLLRSAAFSVGFLALVGMLIVGMAAPYR